MAYKFEHVNFNVANLEKSLKFYEEALGLKEVRRINAENGSFIIVYLRDGKSAFELELTWLKDHPQAYDLGEAEFHLALSVDNYEQSLERHKKMDIVAMVNEEMGIYFITDPDGYWIEIIPQK